MLLVVRSVDYDYLGGCYRRFCRKPNAKHIRLVACKSLMGQLPVSCYSPPTAMACWNAQPQIPEVSMLYAAYKSLCLSLPSAITSFGRVQTVLKYNEGSCLIIETMKV